MRLSILLAAVFAFTAPTLAADPSWLQQEIWRRHFHRLEEQCLAAAAGHTWPMLDCLAKERRRQDQVLERTYRNLIARLPIALRGKVHASQQRWIGRSDRKCEQKIIDANGGWDTMSTLDIANCAVNARIRRSILLERFGAGKASLASLDRDFQ